MGSLFTPLDPHGRFLLTGSPPRTSLPESPDSYEEYRNQVTFMSFLIIKHYALLTYFKFKIIGVYVTSTYVCRFGKKKGGHKRYR